MRTIKFRGKRLDTKQWIEGYLCEDFGGGIAICPQTFFTTIIPQDDEASFSVSKDGRALGGFFPVDPETVGQLWDKDIYEFDIVQWDSGVYQVDGQPDNIIKHAQESLSAWKSTGVGRYDFEGNGWVKKIDTGVVVFYKGSFSLHIDTDMDGHSKTSMYSGTTYYGTMRHGVEYTKIGNIHDNPELLKQ